MDRLVVFRNGGVHVISAGETYWTPIFNFGASSFDAIGWVKMGTVTVEQRHRSGVTTADGVSIDASVMIGVKVWDRVDLISSVAVYGNEHEKLLTTYSLNALQAEVGAERYSSLLTRFIEIGDRTRHRLGHIASQSGSPFYVESVTITNLVATEAGQKSFAVRQHEQAMNNALTKEQLQFDIAASEVRTAIEVKRMLEYGKVLQLSNGLLLIDRDTWKEIELKKLDVKAAESLGGFVRGHERGRLEAYLRALGKQHNITLALPAEDEED